MLIIVLPEYGITSFLLTHSISVFLDYVPNPYNKKLNPCEQAEFNDRPILQRLSCLAKKHGIVIVSNLASKVPCEFDPAGLPCPSTGYFQYNTNVAMAANGQLVAKYNKLNLYTEEQKIFDFPVDGQETIYSGTVFNWFSLQISGMSHDAIFFPEVVTSGVHLAKIGTEWRNDCPACSWVYSDINQCIKEPLLAANLFARVWEHIV